MEFYHLNYNSNHLWESRDNPTTMQWMHKLQISQLLIYDNTISLRKNCRDYFRISIPIV